MFYQSVTWNWQVQSFKIHIKLTDFVVADLEKVLHRAHTYAASSEMEALIWGRNLVTISTHFLTWIVLQKENQDIVSNLDGASYMKPEAIYIIQIIWHILNRVISEKYQQSNQTTIVSFPFTLLSKTNFYLVSYFCSAVVKSTSQVSVTEWNQPREHITESSQQLHRFYYMKKKKSCISHFCELTLWVWILKKRISTNLNKKNSQHNLSHMAHNLPRRLHIFSAAV